MPKKNLSTRKYRITEELQKFSREGRAKKREEICTACVITDVTLSQLENIESGDTRQIGIDWLVIIARVVGCTLEELLQKSKAI